ncbi:response regulator [Candidatus Riflebacteria bacterium]
MSSSGIRLLIVDDEEMIRLNLETYFEDEGYEVYAFQNAEEALEFLKGKLEFQVGIIDLRLPGLDGNALILKARELQPGMKFLIYTGSTNYSIPQVLIDMGISREQVFIKPVADMDILSRAISGLLE